MLVYVYFMLFVVVPLLLIKFLFNYNHFLVSLLVLEYAAISLYFFLSQLIFGAGGDFFFLLYFLIMTVSEGVLGLALLVLVSFAHGVEYLRSFNFLLC